MAGYIGSKAVSVNTTSATITGDASIGGNVTLNDGSADVDFRVESNVSGDTHALFVDGATGHVGLGTSVLGAQFNVKGTGAVDAGIGSTNAGGAYLYLDGDSNGDFSGSDYSFIGHQTDGQLIINQDSPSGTQALLIKTAGTLAATISSSGINLANGNLTVAQGHGINFAAQTPSATGSTSSELLDHYEEGTWTPVVAGADTAGTPSFSSRTGFYTRIGRLVHIDCVLAFTISGEAGTMQLSGMPFQTAAESVGTFQCNNMELSYQSNVGQYSARVADNATLMEFRGTLTNGGEFSAMAAQGMSFLRVALQYQTD